MVIACLLLGAMFIPQVFAQSAADEKDEIYMLTAYSVVLNDWQADGTPDKRGHNIGSILVDDQGNIVRWARNCNARLKNGTQHGEVRLMVGYLSTTQKNYLSGYTIYTSLEPCAQCSGMMDLTQVSRTVYGQTDPAYGKAIERLALNSKAWNEHGYTPYPRSENLHSDRSKTPYCQQLEDAYAQAGGSITKFLLSPTAKGIYEAAAQKLQAYQIEHQENAAVLQQAKQFLQTVQPGIPHIQMSDAARYLNTRAIALMP
ncbi:nucleoside deaminase [Desulfovibrio mangrovi]|uniref:nucleoside deaminase n=1 Tax=Desulfovibrio mangrovi TaxID=2976983 RepID=UPI0022463282|nr:nucleoside deaminase [Desulfovibrio mangrovi]UZP66391.1 nucleoside deaminase [Desulfovibrio mangrovi]